MPHQKLPTVDLDNVNHRKGARERINALLDHSADDSRKQTDAEKLAGITPVNAAYGTGQWHRTGADPEKSDNTLEINNAFLPHSKTYEDIAGTYSVTDNLNAQDNQTIEMSMGVVLKPIAWADTGIIDSGVIDISDKDTVRVDGGVIDGNKADLPVSRIFGIKAYNSSNVTLTFNQILDCPGSDPEGILGGDGWIVYGTSSRFSAMGVICSGNVRNNAAVVQCDGWNVIGGFYDSATGSGPGAGIDIESDNPANPIYDGAIIGVAMRGNYKALQVAHYSTGTNVVGCSMRGSDNGELLITSCDTVGIVACQLVSNPTVNGANICELANTSFVRFSAVDFSGSSNANERAGVVIADSVNRVIFDGCIFRSTETYGIRLGTTSLAGEIIDIEIVNCMFIDCCDPAQNIPIIYIDGNSGSAIYPRRVKIRNNHFYDSRSGGNEATAAVQISTNIPDSISAEYDIGDNYIAGPTSRYVNCPNEGSFPGTLTGCTTSPTGSIGYVAGGEKEVVLQLPAITGTSNTTAATITGMPSYLYPLSTQTVLLVTQDNGTEKLARATISTSGVITLQNALTATFTNSGTKGVSACTVTYRKV